MKVELTKQQHNKFNSMKFMRESAYVGWDWWIPGPGLSSPEGEFVDVLWDKNTDPSTTSLVGSEDVLNKLLELL